MTRKRLAAAVAALIVVAVALTAGLASAQPTASLSGAGSTFVVPLVTALDAALQRRVRQLQRHRQRRRHLRHHGPLGRLRRERRSADSGPGLRLQGLRSDPLGVLGHLDPIQRQRRRLRPQADGHDHRRDLRRLDQVLGQPGDQEDQLRGQPAAREDHADLPQRRQRHELQLHRLPVARQQDLAGQDRERHAAELPGRGRGPRQLRRGGQAAEHARRHHLCRRRLLAAQPLQDRQGAQSRGEVRAPRDQADPGGRELDSQAAQQPERVHRGRPERTREERLPDLHLLLGDRARRRPARRPS